MENSYYGIPVEVKRMSRRERKIWHTKRVQREEPAYQFLESFESFLTIAQLEEKIREIKEYRKKIEATIELLTGAHFISLRNCLIAKLSQVIKLRERRAKLISLKLKRKCSNFLIHNEIEKLKSLEEIEIDKALDIELKITDLCDALDLDPTPHLRIYQLLGEKYA